MPPSPPPEFCHPPTKNFSIAVVGGGIAGLTLTLQLLRHRIPTTLYEQAAQFGEIGAGVSFGPNAQRAMSLISTHLRQAFEKHATFNQSPDHRATWFDFRFGESCGGKHPEGRLIYRLQCAGGQASVHRAHFLDELVKLLPDGVAQFGKRAVGYHYDNDNNNNDDNDDDDNGEDDTDTKNGYGNARGGGGGGVFLRFQDGTTARHDAVIACDGIKSKLRTRLLGESHPAAKAVFSGKYAYRGLVPIEQAEDVLGEELAKNSQMYLGRHGHILTFSVAKGKMMNVVAFRTSKARVWPSTTDWVQPVQKQDLLSDFAGWSPQARSIIRLMQKPDLWALFDHPPADAYHKRRVCLLGDAAHASTPHKGAGAGMAIEDACVLGYLLGLITDPRDIERAFAVYTELRRPRSQRLVAESREQGRLYELEVREDSEGIAESLAASMDWVWEYDLPQEMERGRRLLETKAQL